MKISVIGGTGHFGSFLTPMLVNDGHDVTVVTTGRTKPRPGPAWDKATFAQGKYVRHDRSWSDLISSLGAEVVIDILGTDLPATYEAAKPTCHHLINCGSVWMFGPCFIVPSPDEAQGPCEFEGYDWRFEEILQIQNQADRDGIAFTSVMPPNICGPGKIPLDGLGGRGIDVHKAHQRGDPVPLPERCNNLVGPCDAEDIAQGFFVAALNRDAAAGEIFNVGSAYSLTAPRFIETYGEIYGRPIPIDWIDPETYFSKTLPEPGANFHFREHMCPDITKIRTRLGYEPRHTPEATMERAVGWMKDEGMID